MEDLKKQREALVETASMSYSPDDFPGSAAWQVTCNADKAVATFDVDHPEIIAQIKQDKAAKDKTTADRVISLGL